MISDSGKALLLVIHPPRDQLLRHHIYSVRAASSSRALPQCSDRSCETQTSLQSLCARKPYRSRIQTPGRQIVDSIGTVHLPCVHVTPHLLIMIELLSGALVSLVGSMMKGRKRVEDTK